MRPRRPLPSRCPRGTLVLPATRHVALYYARAMTRLRVLGLFPHPDDESYAAAGTLALCARAGAEVIVAFATRGEGGAAIYPAAVGDAALADVRARELAASCRAIGAAPPRFLDAPDGAVNQDAEFPARVAALLGELRPDLVITLGRDGVYGHRDHLACTAAAEAAIALTEPPPRLLLAAFPRGLFAPVLVAMRRLPYVHLADITPDELGVDEANTDLTVDIRALADVKLASVAAHASQLPGGDPRRFLVPGLLDALLDCERFVLAAGPPLPPGARDALAGLPAPRPR